MAEPIMPAPLDDIAIAHTRRFALTLDGGKILHGVQFPSGRVIADDPIEGLCAATSVEELARPLAVTLLQFGLSEAELVMLRYALDLAQDAVYSGDGFTDDDQAALDSLSRMAGTAEADHA